MAINGDERLNPLRCGFPVCDTVGGLNAAFAIMAALYHRERTGEGQFIDVAMLDSIMPLMGWVAANWLIGGQQPQLMGNDNFTAAPSGTFRTATATSTSPRTSSSSGRTSRRPRRPELKTRPALPEARRAQEEPPRADADSSRSGCETPTGDWVEALNAKGIPSGAIAIAAGRADLAPGRSTADDPDESWSRASVPLRLFTLTREVREDPGRPRNTAAAAVGAHRRRCWRDRRLRHRGHRGVSAESRVV